MSPDPERSRPSIVVSAKDGATRSALSSLLERAGYCVFAPCDADAIHAGPSVAALVRAVEASAPATTNGALDLGAADHPRASFEGAVATAMETLVATGGHLAVFSIAVRHEPFQPPASGPPADLEEKFASEILASALAAGKNSSRPEHQP